MSIIVMNKKGFCRVAVHYALGTLYMVTGCANREKYIFFLTSLEG